MVALMALLAGSCGLPSNSRFDCPDSGSRGANAIAAPEGTIFFARRGYGYTSPGAVFSVPAAGAEERRITGDSTFVAFPAISPNAYRLLFEEGNKVLVILDLNTQVKRVAVKDGNGYLHGSWSPDGTEIAFGTGGEIRIIPSASNGQRTLTSGSADHRPAWGPGATGRIVFLRDLGDRANLFSVRPDGTDLQRLTALRTNDGEAAWSPDGTRIAYSSDRLGSEEIWLMDPDGGNQCRLTKGHDHGVYEPVWSPDGKWIAFVVATGSGGEIWQVPSRGGRAHQLTRTHNDTIAEGPNWSPR